MTQPNQALQSFATHDPAFAAFAAELPAALMQTELPPELLDDVTALLCAERPEFDLWANMPDVAQDRYAVGAIAASAATLAAVVFLLRSRIKLQRKEDGAWSFLFEHKPADNDLMKRVLDALEGIIKPF